MDKRSLVALLLIALVIVGGQLLMPRTPDSVAVVADSVRTTPPATHDSAPAAAQPVSKRAATPSIPVVVRENSGVVAETVSVAAETRGARFTSRGAAPLDI